MAFANSKANAEESIRRSIKRVETDPSGRSFHLSMAYGIFSGWNSLTMGWQTPGDSERLEALTVPIGDRP